VDPSIASMRRAMLTTLVVLALVYAGVCALLFATQRSMLFYPQPRSGAIGTELLRLPIEGGEVLVTVRPRAGSRAVLYFGGNAEDVCRSLDSIAAAFPDHTLYLLHYRGYGGSAGRPSEAALFADALALYDRVRAQHAQVVAVGRSLGSGVAVHLAGRRPVERLILVTPYDSLLAIAAEQFPYLPVRWLMLDRFESWRDAPRIRVPTLVLAAEHDAVVPLARTERLVAHFPSGVVTFRVLAGSDHNSISSASEYVALMRRPP
jgi:pimeloyl-ACP methyl ester carboxylesterase